MIAFRGVLVWVYIALAPKPRKPLETVISGLVESVLDISKFLNFAIFFAIFYL